MLILSPFLFLSLSLSLSFSLHTHAHAHTLTGEVESMEEAATQFHHLVIGCIASCLGLRFSLGDAQSELPFIRDTSPIAHLVVHVEGCF